ncbi:hypothetical protein RRG08_052706 [Elysia crispata]|uniref:Uroporphyrinogen-III synthase n=1 Tax=Elysia crispata TaxID=231223 RepID=A0AAE1B5V8_9GAST|nr:hypothetical protein RRG08_052706 [Elysia crispata]
MLYSTNHFVETKPNKSGSQPQLRLAHHYLGMAAYSVHSCGFESNPTTLSSLLAVDFWGPKNKREKKKISRCRVRLLQYVPLFFTYYKVLKNWIDNYIVTNHEPIHCTVLRRLVFLPSRCTSLKMDGQNGNNLEDLATKKTVFLFKSPKESEPDKFAEALRHAGLTCVNIPVLSFRFINQEDLKSNLSAIHLFSAIIFTSVRAVEAVKNIIQELDVHLNAYNLQSFAVGHTTVEAARKAGFNPQGEESGNSQALCDFILHHVSSTDNRPFLYPCSNLHRDTLKEVLTTNGKDVKEIVAYETCPNDQMKEALEEAIQKQGLPDYVVFFSPSGFQYTVDGIGGNIIHLDRVKIVAIGPTTEKAICDQGYTPFAKAEKPDPQSLLQTLFQERKN